MAEVFTVTCTVSIHFSPAHAHYCQRCSGRTGGHAQISFSLAVVLLTTSQVRRKEMQEQLHELVSSEIKGETPQFHCRPHETISALMSLT